MRYAYIANVGTRDIQRTDGVRITRPRVEGEELLDGCRADPNQPIGAILSAPILTHGIEWVLGSIGGGECIECVQLFATDQPSETLQKYRDSDTWFFGLLLQRLLKERFGSRIGRIECEPMPFNPSDYRETLHYYERTLRRRLPPVSYDMVYVAPVGGADPSNTGLTLDAIRVYRDKCQLLYVTPEGDVSRVDLYQRLRADSERQQARDHLERRDYDALRSCLARARLGPSWHLDLCQYIDHRSRFDFKRAQECLNRAVGEAEGHDRTILNRQIVTEFHPLLEAPEPPTSASPLAAWDAWLGWQRRLIGELYFNLWLKKEAGEWVDLLGRLFRMREALQRLAFEDRTRYSAKRRDGSFRDVDAYLTKDKDLACYLESHNVPSTDLYLSSEVLGKILGYWCESAPGGDPRRGKLVGLEKLCFQKLADLRNDSIIAHGFHGVSRKDIESIISIDRLMETLGNALGALGIAHGEGENPYLRVEAILRAAL